MVEIFLTSHEVEKSLANHETAKCLAWCHDNRSKLRKLKSNMEFNLRIQEFVELIRNDQRMDAIKHARKHFAGFESEHLATIQQVMALLAFSVDTGTKTILIPKLKNVITTNMLLISEIHPYKMMFSMTRWDTLIEEFRQENYRLFQLPNQSVFTVALQAGLSALKTPYPFILN